MVAAGVASATGSPRSESSPARAVGAPVADTRSAPRGAWAAGSLLTLRSCTEGRPPAGRVNGRPASTGGRASTPTPSLVDRGGRVGVGRRLVGVRVRVGVLIDVGVLVGLLGLAVTAAVAGRCRLALGGAGLCYIGGIGGRRVRRVGGGLVGRAVAGAAAGRGGRVGVGRRLVGVRVRVGVLIDVGVLVGLLGLAVTAAVAGRCRLALGGAGLCYIGGIGGRRVRRVGGGLVGRAVAGAAAGRGGRVGVGRRLVGVRVRVGVLIDVGVLVGLLGLAVTAAVAGRCRLALGGAGLCYIGGIGGRRVRRVGGGLVGRAVAGAAAGRGGRVGVGRRLVGVRVRVGVLIDVGVLVGLLGLAVTAAVAGRCRLALGRRRSGLRRRHWWPPRPPCWWRPGRPSCRRSCRRSWRPRWRCSPFGRRPRPRRRPDRRRRPGWTPGSGCYRRRCRTLPSGSGSAPVCVTSAALVAAASAVLVAVLVGRAVAGAAAGRGGRVGVVRRLVGVRVRVGVLIDVGVLVGLLGLAVTAAVAGRCRLALGGAGLCSIGGIGAAASAVLVAFWSAELSPELPPVVEAALALFAVWSASASASVSLIDVGVLVGLLGLAVTAAVAGRCRLALGRRRSVLHRRHWWPPRPPCWWRPGRPSCRRSCRRSWRPRWRCSPFGRRPRPRRRPDRRRRPGWTPGSGCYRRRCRTLPSGSGWRRSVLHRRHWWPPRPPCWWRFGRPSCRRSCRRSWRPRWRWSPFGRRPRPRRRPDRRRRPGWTPGSGCYRRRCRTLPSGSGWRRSVLHRRHWWPPRPPCWWRSWSAELSPELPPVVEAALALVAVWSASASASAS